MSEGNGLSQMIGEPMLKTQCRESEGQSQRCLNPLCGNPVEPKRKHAPVKHYCCGECGQKASVINRAATLLEGLSDQEVLRIIKGKP